MENIAGAWKLLLATGAGTGGVLILRWFWWRVNAWSEVAAMVTAFAVSISLQLWMGYNTDDPNDFAVVMLWTVAVTTVAWVAVTYLTGPEPRDKLISFYKRVRPYRVLWGPIPAAAGDAGPRPGPGRDLLHWAAGCGLIYGALFGVGKLLLGEISVAAVWLALGAASANIIHRGLRRRPLSDDAITR